MADTDPQFVLPAAHPETEGGAPALSRELLAAEALRLVRAWTHDKPEEADDSRIQLAIETVLAVHEMARDRIERRSP